MKFEDKILVGTIGFLIIIFIILIGLAHQQEIIDESIWNNGYCDNCGGEWVFTNGSRGTYTLTYFYICEDCEKIIHLYSPKTQDD